MDTDISSHEQWFSAYTERYRAVERQDVKPIDLKIEHTGKVLEHARRIVEEERPEPVIARACVLAALYHDVARFPQYARWHTFKDSVSVDHGLFGVTTLKAEERLAEEPPAVRRLVLAAVGMHNRFKVPASLPEDARRVTDVVRDADKLDIFRVMAGHLTGPGPRNDAVILHVKDDPHLWTPAVVEDVLAGRVAAYADLRSVNDFRLLLGTWMYDLRYAATRRQLKSSGLVPELLAELPDDAPVRAARTHLLAVLERLA